jgi:excisionase family DNA binding protein
MERLYRVREVAEITALGHTKAYELIKRGVIPSVKIDGCIRVSRQALEAFIGSLKSTTPSDSPA